MTFTWHGQTLDYFDHPYNATRQNERAVELAIASQFVNFRGQRKGLEVGNVLGHYDITGHRVVDLHERARGVENLDVFDLTGTYDWIVSISTVEHVRWDTEPHQPQGAFEAIEHLRGLLAPDGVMLITVPLGYHPPLDEAIQAGVLEPSRDCVFIRQGRQWVQRTRKTWRPYGASTPWAEAVWIGEW